MAKKGRPKGTGVSRPVQRSRNQLAVLLRTEFPPKLVSDFYKKILEGQVPELVRDERCTETNGWRVDSSVSERRSPTLDQRMTAMARIIERSHGMPAQSIHIEAEIENQLKLSIGVDEAASLPEEVRAAIRKAVSNKAVDRPGLPAGRPTPEPDFSNMDVVDADFEMIPINKGKGYDGK